ncbi:MAG: endopeptidase IV [Tatlockia sp.]|nr:endopeptidase IV [Tatlockia sp.]
MKLTNNSTLSRAILLSLLAIGVANVDAKQQAPKNENEEIMVQEGEEVAIKDKEKDENRPPIGCRESGYKFDLQAMHLQPGSSGENQSMYLLHNQTGQAITLYQMRNEDSSRSLFLNHSIGPHEWGILSTGEKQVKFICTIPNKKSQYGQVVDCETSFKICEYTNVRYGLNNRGNFWLFNSSTRNGAVSAIVYYGIIPGN